MLKRWRSIKEIDVCLLCEINFNFKQYAPTPKILLQASLSLRDGWKRRRSVQVSKTVGVKLEAFRCSVKLILFCN